MPYIIQNGVPVRVGISPPEVVVAPEFGSDLTCPECGREYKTEAGLDNHLASKH